MSKVNKRKWHMHMNAYGKRSSKAKIKQNVSSNLLTPRFYFELCPSMIPNVHGTHRE